MSEAGIFHPRRNNFLSVLLRQDGSETCSILLKYDVVHLDNAVKPNVKVGAMEFF
jgi:hypothetical protein